jgi:VWFA-related protein
MKNFIFGFCLLLLSTPLGFTQQEVEVTSIHVWIAVEGSKGPLAEKDFEVYEDGKKMTPTCFVKVLAPQPSTSASSGSEASEIKPQILQGKRIAIFVDQLNTSKAEFEFIRPKINEFLKQIDEKTEIMLAAVPPFEPVVDFTTDAVQIQGKLDGLTGNDQRDYTMMERRRQIELVLESQVPPPLDKAAILAQQFQYEETQEAQVFLNSFDGFAKYLQEHAKEEDHTVVLLISGGINSRPGQQYWDMIYSISGRQEENPLNEAGRVGFDIRRAVQKSIGKLNRDNQTIYTISTRGQIQVVDDTFHSDRRYAPKDEKRYREDYQNTLAQIAHETGGIAFENSLNFKHGFDAVINDLTQQYLICYQAPEHDDDGEYHEIKVKSKVKGIKLRHREGYVD